MWTVGRPNFGENEKHPAVMEALERMVELILKNQSSPERLRQARLLNQRVSSMPFDRRWVAELTIFRSAQGILDVDGVPTAPLETIQMDDALHELSTSMLRIPTKAITTLPRDENMQPINEKFDPGADTASVGRGSSDGGGGDGGQQPANFGGNWILGSDKGVYLRVTNRSVVANEETDDEESDATPEEFQFPFSRSRRINIGAFDDDQDDVVDEEERKREEEEEDQERRREQEKLEQDLRNDQLAWSFFAGSISRARAEEILEYVAQRMSGLGDMLE